MTINEIIKQAHATANEKGWWDKPRTGLEIMALIHSEVSEAVECLRNNKIKPESVYSPCYKESICPVFMSCSDEFSNHQDRAESYKECMACRKIAENKPVGLPSELADIIIRIAEYCGHENIDLEAAIKAKMAHNRPRPWLHGGKNA